MFFSGLSIFIRRSVNSDSSQPSCRRVRFGFFSHEMTFGPHVIRLCRLMLRTGAHLGSVHSSANDPIGPLSGGRLPGKGRFGIERARWCLCLRSRPHEQKCGNAHGAASGAVSGLGRSHQNSPVADRSGPKDTLWQNELPKLVVLTVSRRSHRCYPICQDDLRLMSWVATGASMKRG